MAQLIAPTNAAVTSSDQVLAANSSTMFSLTGATQPYGSARIEKKGSDGNYVPMTGGGGAQMSSANYKVDITSGQSAVMFAYSPGYDLQMGFWGRWGMPRTHRSYLPNIRR